MEEKEGSIPLEIPSQASIPEVELLEQREAGGKEPAPREMAPKELSLSSAASRSPPRPELRSVSVAVSPPPRSSPKLRSFRNVENLSLPPLETQRSVSESFGQSIASASSKLASSSGRHEGIGSSNSSMATSNSAITSSPHRPKSIQSSHGQAASPSLKAFLSTPEGKKAREHADSASFSLDSRAEGDFSTHASSPEKSHASSGESRRHIMYADRGQLGSDERTGGAREMELQSFVDSDGKDEGLHLEEFDDAVSQTLVPAKEQRDQKGSKQTWVCWKVLICTGIGLIVVSVLGMAAMILGPLLFKKVNRVGTAGRWLRHACGASRCLPSQQLVQAVNTMPA